MEFGNSAKEVKGEAGTLRMIKIQTPDSRPQSLSLCFVVWCLWSE